MIASFWIGNVLLVLLNVPLISIWVKVLQVPYRFLYPSRPVLYRRGRL
ncbi:MAG: tripartite tricarboxylate transporter permease [Rhodospirillales bacterium]